MLAPLSLANKFARFQLALAAIAILAILITISFDVILRATLNAPISSTIEIVSFYCMIPVVFFPIMFLEITGQHIDTDLFYLMFPRGIKRLSIVVSGLLTIGIYSVLAYFTFIQAITSTNNGEVSMGVNLMPIWPVRWVLPIVFASSAIAAAMLSIKRMFVEDNDV